MAAVTQNIYDDPEFLAGYRTLPRSVHGLDGAPEWPAVRAVLPDVHGRVVVDLGCGFGWFCRWARDQGAARVVGVDVSAAMLDEAKTDARGIEYRHAGLEDLDLDEGVDLVYSSLALHYVEDLERLIQSIAASLAPAGALVLTVEHPVFSAPSRPTFLDTDRGTVWPLDGYLTEGPRTTNWFVDGVVKMHRTIGSYVRLLVESGLTITHLEEWGPSTLQVEANPEWAAERDRPPFLIIRADRTT